MVSKKEQIDFPVKSENPIVDWIIRFFEGMIIGTGFILPGVSGGVLAMIFGLYRIILRFLSNIFDHFFEHVKFFLPVGLGGIVSVLFLSEIIGQALAHYQAQAICVFLGFVVGTFPSLWNKAGAQGRSSADRTFFGLCTLVVTVLMVLLGSKSWIQLPATLPVWIFCGAIIGLGVIVPGMSPSNFLLYFGLYKTMTLGIANLDFSIILPVLLGALLSVMLMARVVRGLLATHYTRVYHFILAMIMSSTLAIFLTQVWPIWRDQGVKTLLTSLLAFALGTLFTFFFSKLEKSYSRDEDQL